MPTADRRTAARVLSHEGAIDVLVVRAGGQRLGLLAQTVEEVQRIASWEPLPGAPPMVKGVLDLRGRIVPVIDLAERLDLPPSEPAITDHLVVARAADRILALHVQAAEGLARVPSTALEQANEGLPHIERLRGVARLPDALLVIVDLDAFLGWSEAADLDRALSARSEGTAVG